MRAGGRVHAKTLTAHTRGAKTGKNAPKPVEVAADLGGSVITGVLGNPLAVVARQMGLRMHKVRDSCPLYHPSGEEVDEGLDKWVEAKFNCMLDLASRCTLHFVTTLLQGRHTGLAC